MMVEQENLQANDKVSWLDTLWQALEAYREDCIPERDESYDSQWNDICTAMAWIREELGLPDEVSQESEGQQEKPVCSDCGSAEVFRDAYASWDIDTQQWIMQAVYDEAVCDACGDSCSLEWKPEPQKKTVVAGAGGDPIPSLTRDMERFDGLEIHPVADIFDETQGGFRPQDAAEDETCFAICEPEDAQLWGVYGHLKEGGIDSIEDFKTEEEANGFAELLIAAYPHLKTHGIAVG